MVVKPSLEAVALGCEATAVVPLTGELFLEDETLLGVESTAEGAGLSSSAAFLRTWCKGAKRLVAGQKRPLNSSRRVYLSSLNSHRQPSTFSMSASMLRMGSM